MPKPRPYPFLYLKLILIPNFFQKSEHILSLNKTKLQAKHSSLGQTKHSLKKKLIHMVQAHKLLETFALYYQQGSIIYDTFMNSIR